MEIIWTERALEKLSDQLQGRGGHFHLKYETEGCGCVMSGVWNLFVLDEVPDGMKKWETNAYPVYINENHEVFLDEKILIDYTDGAGTFQLKSPNQYLNPMMSCRIVSAG